MPADKRKKPSMPLRKSNLYTCPFCLTSHKRRKGGRCPNCGREVVIRDGRWEPPGPSAAEIITAYFYLRLSLSRNVRAEPPRQSSKAGRRVRGLAKRLVDKCDGNITKAKLIIDLAFAAQPKTPDLSYIMGKWFTDLSLRADQELQKLQIQARHMNIDRALKSANSIQSSLPDPWDHIEEA